MRAEIGVGAEIGAERLRGLQQRVEHAHGGVAILRVHAQPAPRGDQRAGDRVGEVALRQHELGGAAVAGQPGGIAGDQVPDHRQPGPGMRRQVLLADAVRGLRVAAGQRDGDHQRRRVRPVAQMQFGLQADHAVVVADRPGQPHVLAVGGGARRLGPGGGRRAVGDHGQVPACQSRCRRGAPPGGRRRSGPGRPGSSTRRGRGTAWRGRSAPGSARRRCR